MQALLCQNIFFCYYFTTFHTIFNTFMSKIINKIFIEQVSDGFCVISLTHCVNTQLVVCGRTCVQVLIYTCMFVCTAFMHFHVGEIRQFQQLILVF